MRSRVLSALGLLAGAFILASGIAYGASGPTGGTFALQGAKAKVQAMLTVVPERDPLAMRLDLWESLPGSPRPLRTFEPTLMKDMHLIAVSDDFGTFLHVHPVLGQDGHFRVALHVPRPAVYHLYADADPKGIGQQVVRFDVPIGGGTRPRSPDLAPSANSVTVGPYAVSLSSTTLESGHETMLVAHIRMHGTPARDLHPYLGAMAHAVFVNESDLSYVHTHAASLDTMGQMQMRGASSMGAMTKDASPLAASAHVAPDMMLHAEVHEPGTYKLWLQFRGGSQLYVAPFVLHAR